MLGEVVLKDRCVSKHLLLITAALHLHLGEVCHLFLSLFDLIGCLVKLLLEVDVLTFH